MLSNAGPAQRRELLNKCRVAAGLETVEDVEGHARFVQANEALLYRPHRPVPSCAVCGAHPTTPQGMPDPNIPAVQRRPSHHRDRLVRDQRDEQTHASEHAGARLEVTAADPDRELRVLTPGLLPQPGGCEGFGLVEEHLEVSRPATFDGPDVCQGEADRDTALPTDCVRGQESKHAPIGRLAHFFHLPPLIRPRLILFREPLPYASSASVGDVACRSPVHYPFDPRTQELEVELACALPRLEACTDEFDVLLRHRLRRISRKKRCCSAQMRLGRLDHEDRAGCLVGDRVRHAAENPAMHALVADHEEIGPALRRKAHQHIARLTLVDAGGAIDPLALQVGFRPGENLANLGRAADGPVDLPRRTGSLPRSASRLLESAEENELGVEPPRKIDRHFERLACCLRAVGSNSDRRDHSGPTLYQCGQASNPPPLTTSASWPSSSVVHSTCSWSRSSSGTRSAIRSSSLSRSVSERSTPRSLSGAPGGTVDRLFPQPGGLEGLTSIHVALDADYASVTHLVDHRGVGLHLYPAPLPAPKLVQGHDDAVAGVDELLRLQSALIPGLAVLLEEIPDLLGAAPDAAFGEPTDRAMKLGVRRELRHRLFPPPVSDGVNDAANDLHVLLRHRLLGKPGGLERSESPRLALDDVVDVEHLWLAWLDPDIGQHWHQTLAKRFELLARVIDLANAKVTLRAEADVVIHPVGGKVTGVRQATDTLVVLLRRQRRRGEADNDAHCRSSSAWGRADPIRLDVLVPGSGDALLRNRLLPQPGGFEGLGLASTARSSAALERLLQPRLIFRKLLGGIATRQRGDQLSDEAVASQVELLGDPRVRSIAHRLDRDAADRPDRTVQPPEGDLSRRIVFGDLKGERPRSAGHPSHLDDARSHARWPLRLLLDIDEVLLPLGMPFNLVDVGEYLLWPSSDLDAFDDHAGLPLSSGLWYEPRSGASACPSTGPKGR